MSLAQELGHYAHSVWAFITEDPREANTEGGIFPAIYGTVLMVLLMTVVVMATRRGRPRRRWMALVIGVFLHLVLDAIWTAPESLLWPFLGWAFSPHGAAGAGAYLGDVLGSPWYWLQEAAGALFLRADPCFPQDLTRKNERFYHPARHIAVSPYPIVVVTGKHRG